MPPPAFAQVGVVVNLSHFEGGYNVSCNGAYDGTIEAIAIGSNGPFFYAWSNGATTSSIQNIPAGVYTVTVTDFSNATHAKTVELFQPDGMAVHLYAHEFDGGTNISKQGENDGIIEASVLGGTPPYSYVWSNGQNDPHIEGLVQGTYSLSVTDATNCTAIANVTLIEPSQLHITSITSQTHIGYNLTCFNSHNGNIDLSVSGGIPPYRYQWNNGSFDEDQTSLEAGHYMVRVFDRNNAEVDGQITLTQPNELILSFTKSQFQGNYNISCYGCANGTIQANVIGGVTPYTYNWGTSQTTQTISNLTIGSYGIHLIDANGCIVSNETPMLQPDREDWTMSGNANTNSTTQFIGTSDSTDLVFKTNNIESFRIKSNGELKATHLSGTGESLLVVDSLGTFSRKGIIVVNPPNGCTSINVLPWYQAQSNTNDVWSCNRRFGLGTNAPTEKLHVAGNSIFTLDLTSLQFIPVLVSAPMIKGVNSYSTKANPDYTWYQDNTTGIFHPSNHTLGFSVDGSEAMRLIKNTTGETTVLVGFSAANLSYSLASTPYKMLVDGKFGANEIYCSMGTPSWPDYVFNKEHKLLSFVELKNFLKENKHLPGIPAANEIAETGMNLGKLVPASYEKIEELYLYVIQLEERIKELERYIEKK